MTDRLPLPTYNFALLVVRRPSDGKFLLVEEIKNRGWWLPGGRVELGERFDDAAKRECKEEAGIDIKLVGVLRVEHSVMGSGKSASARMRIAPR